MSQIVGPTDCFTLPWIVGLADRQTTPKKSQRRFAEIPIEAAQKLDHHQRKDQMRVFQRMNHVQPEFAIGGKGLQNHALLTL